jgi:hypothetical protein
LGVTHERNESPVLAQDPQGRNGCGIRYVPHSLLRELLCGVWRHSMLTGARTGTGYLRVGNSPADKAVIGGSLIAILGLGASLVTALCAQLWWNPGLMVRCVLGGGLTGRNRGGGVLIVEAAPSVRLAGSEAALPAMSAQRRRWSSWSACEGHEGCEQALAACSVTVPYSLRPSLSPMRPTALRVPEGLRQRQSKRCFRV